MKQVYTSPTLKRLGSVEEFTRASGTLASTEPIFNQTPKQAP